MYMENDFTAFEVWPGPMEGVGRESFVRAVNALHLTDRWMTPFLRLSGTMPSLAKLRNFPAEYLNSGQPVTLQLMGTEPELLGRCGAELLKMTAVKDINLNAGCPSLRVVKNGAGGGMLKTPEKVAVFCQTLASYLPQGKLSIKLRAGYCSPEDMQIFLPALARNQAVSKIFFHYRTVSESYSPAPLPERERRIARAVELAFPVPVIANGDITTAAEGAELVRATGCAGVMIARPWMHDPYLLQRFTRSCPDAEYGRELFFAELQKQGVTGGALLEMARMLWGVNSPKFRKLLHHHGNISNNH